MAYLSEGALDDVLARFNNLTMSVTETAGQSVHSPAGGFGNWAAGGAEVPYDVGSDGPPGWPGGRATPDLELTNPVEYRRRAEAKLRELTLTQTEQEALERRTRRDREAWFAARRGRITASVFQRVSNMRPTTPCDSLLEVLLYGAGRELDTPALRYGRQNEERAIREYERRTGVLVRHPVGLVVHPEHGFLAATPDGWVAPGLILEVKCPQRAANTPLRELAAAGGSFCLDRAMKLRRGHPYYGQVQAQMACCGARFCDFFVWTPHESECDRIAFDPDFWQQKIGPVREFFLECLLPEMVDPRKARGLPYRERRNYRPRRH
ncbi:hypothetical protein FJT64_025014 [Amphibalanus amphitrite]|uniref:YqaJ viral recombinase domain-containing protein n=1 Tax=Amphibalanus amphitrite TaxID=1232801 RepID=A0A6A4W6I5_AMPAM|nr:hypothetical protein FJT64_025014 [Amphibalanus amphitrite]